MHREDFARSSHARGGSTSPVRQDSTTSQYIIEISNKLRWIQREILNRFHCGDDTKEW